MQVDRQIYICQYQNCQRNGSDQVLAAFLACPASGVTIVASGCLGQCNLGPTVHITPDEVWYCRVRASDVPQIISQHCQAGQPVKALLHPRFHPNQEV